MTHRRRRCCCCPIPVQCNQISCGKRHMFNQLRTRRRHIEQDALRVGSNLCISYCPPPPPWMAFRKLPTNRLSSPFVIPLPLPAAAAPPTSGQVRIVGPSEPNRYRLRVDPKLPRATAIHNPFMGPTRLLPENDPTQSGAITSNSIKANNLFIDFLPLISSTKGNYTMLRP